MSAPSHLIEFRRCIPNRSTTCVDPLRDVPFLVSDRFSHYGVFDSKVDGRAAGFLRRKHNELYKARTAELR